MALFLRLVVVVVGVFFGDVFATFLLPRIIFFGLLGARALAVLEMNDAVDDDRSFIFFEAPEEDAHRTCWLGPTDTIEAVAEVAAHMPNPTADGTAAEISERDSRERIFFFFCLFLCIFMYGI